MRIRSTRIYIEEELIPAVLEIQGSAITDILPYDTGGIDCDYGDALISPGFIDIHCHGAYGFDTNSADPEGLRNWAKNIPSEGVTGFLATTVTDNKDTLLGALRNVDQVCSTHHPGSDGAAILGVHLEGPYIDPEHAGAQPVSAIKEPDISEFEEYCTASGNRIRIVTLAPEKDTGHALIRCCREHGIVPSIGHTGASFAEAEQAIHDGALSVTHTFNAMTPFKHRENGTAGAALRHADVYSEIICDTRHVSADALHIFFTCKDKNHAVMISDSLMCKGFPAGTRFVFGGQNIEIAPDGTAFLYETADRTLAGSTMKMNEGLRNLITKADVPLVKALNACTANPASLLGLDHTGMIRKGYDADITVLDENFEVLAVYCKGIRQ